MRQLLTASLVLGALPLLAQTTLTGTVLDEQGTAVPFAVVEMPAYQLGVQADQQGQFSLPLPPATTLTDSLTVSALGYARRRVAVPTAAVCTLRLAALPVALATVVVRPAAPQWVGFAGNPAGPGFGQSGLTPEKHTGWQVARFCQPPSAGYLTGVRFFVKPARNCGNALLRAPFRVRVYAADGPNHSPGTDLLTTTVLAAATQKGWVEIDLSSYALAFPAQGLYVAMEWVYTSDEFLCRYTYTQPGTREKKVGTSYGQALGGNLTDQTQTWYHTIAYGWRKFTAHPTQSPQQTGDAAIQARFQP